MGFYVNPPADSFEEILNGKNYVDKTLLIDYMNGVLSTPDMLVMSTRPRRFGKSFAAKMLSAYYSKGANSEKLFENLNISEKPSFQQHLNKYDVIFIDISAFMSMADDVEDTVSIIQSEIIEELKEIYPEYIRKNTKSLLKALTQVNAKTGNKFFMIIDEWDALFREAPNNQKLQKVYIKFLHSLFENTQTSQLFVGVYMTGILPIGKYGAQFALTDLREYTMLEPGPLTRFVGFTEAEVKRLCEENDIDFAKTQEWYDGYRFSTNSAKTQNNAENGYEHIYCPYSIMQLLTRRKFDNYWLKTETYKSLQSCVDLDYDRIKESLADMLSGKSCKVNVKTFRNDMTNILSTDNILILLVHLGYLSYDCKLQEVSIPNKEVTQEFNRVLSFFGYTKQ